MLVSVVTNALDQHRLWRMSAIHQRLQIKLCPRRLVFVWARGAAYCILWMILFNFLVDTPKYIPSRCHHDGYVWWNYFLYHCDTNPHQWVLKIIFPAKWQWQWIWRLFSTFREIQVRILIITLYVEWYIYGQYWSFLQCWIEVSLKISVGWYMFQMRLEVIFEMFPLEN